MVKAGGGKIINTGSMMSIFGAPYAVAYAASKGGIVQMTKAHATAWAKDNIQVNAILPGWIDTDLTRAARQQVEGLHERVLARTARRSAGASPTISPASPCSWRAALRISSPRCDRRRWRVFVDGVSLSYPSPEGGRVAPCERSEARRRVGFKCIPPGRPADGHPPPPGRDSHRLESSGPTSRRSASARRWRCHASTDPSPHARSSPDPPRRRASGARLTKSTAGLISSIPT